MSSCAIPELVIGDFIEAKHKKSSKIFELEDIACWEKDKTIKTINFVEHEIQSYKYDTKKAFKTAVKRLKQKAKLILFNGDEIIIKCSHDARPYQIKILGAYSDKTKIGRVYFNKMMRTG